MGPANEKPEIESVDAMSEELELESDNENLVNEEHEPYENQERENFECDKDVSLVLEQSENLINANEEFETVDFYDPSNWKKLGENYVQLVVEKGLIRVIMIEFPGTISRDNFLPRIILEHYLMDKKLIGVG